MRPRTLFERGLFYLWLAFGVLLFLAALGILIGEAHAQTATTTGPFPTFSWTAPTKNTDGSPVATLDHYKLTCDGISVAMPAGNLTSYKLTTALAAGSHTCTIDVTDANGDTSAESSPVNFTVVLPNPNPPAGLSVS